MAVSLLALDYLKTESLENFSFATDREFWKFGSLKPDAEADLFCVSDGILTVGEAKKENRLGENPSDENSEIKKYKRLAAGLSVRRLVFATTSESWNPYTVERVKSALSEMPHLAVRFLTAAQLYTLASE